MENYIMLDGKKIVLTEEQVAQLRNDDSASYVPSRFNPCDRTKGSYWYCMDDRKSLVSVEIRDTHEHFDNELYDGVANYFNDEDFARHVALNMLLYRKLLQYAYNNDLVDDKPWDGATPHAFIAQYIAGQFAISYIWTTKSPCTVYFKSEVAAKMALENVVQPFIAEHPNFRVVW